MSEHPFSVFRANKTWRLYVTDFPASDTHKAFTTVALHTTDAAIRAEQLLPDTVNVIVGNHANLFMTNTQAHVLRDQLNGIVL